MPETQNTNKTSGFLGALRSAMAMIGGKDKSKMTPQELQAHNQRSAVNQRNAVQMAQSAMENPGESHMNANVGSGGGISLTKLAAALRKF